MCRVSLLLIWLHLLFWDSTCCSDVITREQYSAELKALKKMVDQCVDSDLEMRTLREQLDNVTGRLEAVERRKYESECTVKMVQDVSTSDKEVQSACRPSSSGFVCPQLQDEQGWIDILRRHDGSVDFYRGWQQYENGFGFVKGELWLGLKTLHEITMSGRYKLRVELRDFAGNAAYAEYSDFYINGPDDFYRLYVSGYHGTAGDGMAIQNNQRFTTKDKDNDQYTHNCAVLYTGAWWYNSCYHSNLNGWYKMAAAEGSDGVVWQRWTNDKSISLRRAEMKIKLRTV